MCAGHQDRPPHGGSRTTENGVSARQRRSTAMAVVTIRQLLDSGVHFGHQTRRWNPKVKRFILTERSGIHIIDLQQSLAFIDKAYDYVKATVAHGGTVLFVGTKKQAQEAIAEQATRVGQPYVNQRWLGGMLTNFQTVAKRIQRMKELEEIDFDDVAGSAYTKKELLLVKATVAHGGTVLFVGTKKQAQEAIAEQATRVGQPYVNQRWLGGMLTNFQTVAKRIQRMKELEEIDFDDVAGSAYTKKELLLLKRELTKLESNLGGIRNLTKAPSVLWIVDTKKEHLAVDE